MYTGEHVSEDQGKKYLECITKDEVVDFCVLNDAIGYLLNIWNRISVYDFGFINNVEPEFPNTGGHMNKYIYF